MAWTAARLRTKRCILLDLLHACDCLHGDLVGLAAREIDTVSAAESLAGLIELRCSDLVGCSSFNGLRLRALRVSVPRASVFHFRKAAQRCCGSVFLALLPGAGLCSVANSSPAAENDSLRRSRSVHGSRAKRG